MERRLTEEQITKAILKWLISQEWEIICFDFPQSGTGYVLHPNTQIRTSKNKGAIIPDIVACKNSIAIFFENKDRFVMSDFEKTDTLKSEHGYSNSIEKLLFNKSITNIYYGVGLPKKSKIEADIERNKGLIDFALLVESNSRSIEVVFDLHNIFKL